MIIAILLSALLFSPAVLLLWMWNKETPTLKRERKGR
jgi:hypothetical protein